MGLIRMTTAYVVYVCGIHLTTKSDMEYTVFGFWRARGIKPIYLAKLSDTVVCVRDTYLKLKQHSWVL